jgi:DNA-binding beta-propeller fold protein YncE
VEVSADGATVYVADAGNNCIRAVTYPTGDVSTLAGSAAGAAGDAVGAVGAARFRSPRALARSGSVLFVADSGNGNIKAVSLLGAGAGVRLVGPAGDGAPAGIQVFPGSAGASLLVSGGGRLDVVHPLSERLGSSRVWLSKRLDMRWRGGGSVPARTAEKLDAPWASNQGGGTPPPAPRPRARAERPR